jgi:diaminopimelate decarboxylase
MSGSRKLDRPPGFTYNGEVLHCERVPLPRLAARFGTPLYVYSGSTIRQRFAAFQAAFTDFPHTVCYSVKANSNLALLRMLAGLGAGFDIVSGGELQRVIKAERRAARRVVFSGVGKTAEEIQAALRAGILMFNIESEGELDTMAGCAARLKKRAPVALRVNPDVDASTHPYISTGLHKHKFGVPLNEARRLYRRAAQERWLDVAGISMHIGSQITRLDAFAEAVGRLADLARSLNARGHRIRYLDAGGGLGISYDDLDLPAFPAHAAAYARAITAPLRGLDVHLLLEPGRAIVGPAGALLTRALYLKRNDHKRFIVVDAAMNDLIRPSLYGAHHDIAPVQRASKKTAVYDVVGPICESGDFFARERRLPAVAEGDLLAILDTGAYGMAISSNYNTRGRAAEVLVEGASARLIRKRDSFADMVRNELA